jgi:hypothetical protein
MHPEEVVFAVEQFSHAMEVFKNGKPALSGAHIETWRQDESVAIMSWSGKDGLNRNLGVTIEQQLVHMEASIWRDNGNTRCYAHLKIATLPLTGALLDTLREIEKAYDRLNQIYTIDIAQIPATAKIC